MIRLPSTPISTASRLAVLTVAALAGCAAGPIFAQTSGPLAPPAHVSYVEGSVALATADGEGDAVESTPLLPGDRLRTGQGRAEVILGDGSSVQLDGGTALDLVDEGRLGVADGRIALAATEADAERLRIDTPQGSVTIEAAGEYRVRLFRTSGRDTVELTVITGRARLSSDQDDVIVNAGERSWARVGELPAYPVRFDPAAMDTFDRWALDRAAEPTESTSAEYLPDDLRPYADVLDTYGSWSYEPSYGRVWYPRVEPTWRPYHVGHWGYYPRYGWTWVGGGAWGWPTHHYGHWGLSGTGTWFWSPGAQWSPAWVSWAVAADYVGWCPMGRDGRPVLGWNAGLLRGPSASAARRIDGRHTWTVVPRRQFERSRVMRGVELDGRRFAGPNRPRFEVAVRPPGPPTTRGAGRTRGMAPPGPAAPQPTDEQRVSGSPGTDRRAGGGSAADGVTRAGAGAAATAAALPARRYGSAPAQGSLAAAAETRRARDIERTPEELEERRRQSAADTSIGSARHLPGDVGPRPSEPGGAKSAAGKPATAGGWSTDQVPVYRGGRVEVGGRGQDAERPGSSPELPTPSAWRVSPPPRRLGSGYATTTDGGGRAPGAEPAGSSPVDGGDVGTVTWGNSRRGESSPPPGSRGVARPASGHAVPASSPRGAAPSSSPPARTGGPSPRAGSRPASPPPAPPAAASRQGPSAGGRGGATMRGAAPPPRPR